MIKSFKCKETEKIYKRIYSKKLPPNIQKVALRKLWMIDAALNINDLRIPPANHLEILKNKRQRQYSIRINNQWRICFKWKNNDAYEIEIIDYH
ncbi:MAG: type II toxin-antitoxin system RelE/ParE family toxin [Patescibacteria group bacterium]|nr:type II toxin-antitoxin system RelE/ParE family toxin [Patescibacteria group bacterium]